MSTFREELPEGKRIVQGHHQEWDMGWGALTGSLPITGSMPLSLLLFKRLGSKKAWKQKSQSLFQEKLQPSGLIDLYFLQLPSLW